MNPHVRATRSTGSAAEAAGRGDIDIGTAKALTELLDVRDRLELVSMAELLDAIESTNGSQP